MRLMSPQRMMHILFAGLIVGIGYGAAGFLLLSEIGDRNVAQQFLTAYVTWFDAMLSTGLIAGTAWMVYKSQQVIPATVEQAFKDDPAIWSTRYTHYRGRFRSRVRSMTIIAVYSAIGWAIFSYCRFPLPKRAAIVMLIVASAQYGIGAYVGRKLCYAGMMLHSLLDIEPRRNLFKKRELDPVNEYVHIASTLTIVFVYVHVSGFYHGPFNYNTWLGAGPRALLLFPAFVATPVLLIFNVYSRMALRQLYSQSIDVEISKLQDTLRSKNLTEYETRSYLAAVDKMARDELRYSLQLTLSDLPIGLTVAVMILKPLFSRA